MEPNNVAPDVLHEFLETSPEGKQMNPLNLAVDDVKPSSSRMKFYFQIPRTSFSSVREIMSMGGRIIGVDA